MADRLLFTLTPYMASFPSTGFAWMEHTHATERRPVLAFDPDTPLAAIWTFVAPEDITTPVKAVVKYCVPAASSGKVDFEGSMECIADGDSIDLSSSASWDTANTITAPTIPGTAGYPDEFTITLTNNDTITAGDLVRFKLERDADDGTNDTCTAECLVLAVGFYDDGG